MPTSRPPQVLQDLIELYRSPLHSHYRQELDRLDVPPDAPFKRKLAAFRPDRLFAWVWNYLKNRIGPRCRFATYVDGETGIFELGDDSVIGGQANLNGDIRISLAGDWGTGVLEAADVATHIDAFQPHFTIHLGDVYYVGDRPEVIDNCLGGPGKNGSNRYVTWPVGSVGSFALNGNHEMYARGEGYFKNFLPKLGMRPSPGRPLAGQKTSYFCLQNRFWRILGLDTGYNSIGIPILEEIFSPSCELPKELVAWLERTLSKEDKRGLIILSHHQYYSGFDKWYTKPATQLKKLNLIDKPVLWFWGHEHRMATYDLYGIEGGIQAHGRCIGHGGMPVSWGDVPKRTECRLLFSDTREYITKDIRGVGFNGFVNLKFAAHKLSVEYRDLEDQLILNESWAIDLGSGILQGPTVEKVHDAIAPRRRRAAATAR